MGRASILAVVVCLGGCVALTGVGDLEAVDAIDGGGGDATPGPLGDATLDDGHAGDDDAGPTDATADATSSKDAEADSPASKCDCAGLVSAYRFTDGAALGKDALGHNTMTPSQGVAKQSEKVPPGMTGKSLELDGASNLCIAKPFTFDASKDHTLCWWSQPAALGSMTNQFAQTCTYDTWTSSDGKDYVWRINNCNGGTAEDYTVPAVYAVGQWVQICQTYEAATKKHTMIIDGNVAAKTVAVGTVPISADADHTWCIGAYDTGGYWKGLIYLPTWWSRILPDTDLANIAAKTCCLPP